MSNPTHQFLVTPIVDIQYGGLDLSFTNASLWMAIAAITSITFLSVAMKRKAIIPGRMQVIAEGAYGFIANMIRDNIGPKGQQYFPLVFTIFMIVFAGNALGLLPYAFTYTSHFIVTAALSFLVFFTVVIIGIYKHGLHFFSLFLPPGVPWWMAILIVPIELISFMIRPITLSVRLTANMIGGHIMIKVFAGFCVSMLSVGAVGYVGAVFPMLFNVIMTGFEFLIAFLQAYVFAILSCIYLKDTVEIGH